MLVYQAGKVILLSATPSGLVQLPRNFDKPMGLAVSGSRLAVATRNEVVVLANDPKLSQGYPPAPGQYDGFFAPRAVYFSGEVDLHDLAWSGPTLWAVNTRFLLLVPPGRPVQLYPALAAPFCNRLHPG